MVIVKFQVHDITPANNEEYYFYGLKQIVRETGKWIILIFEYIR